MSLTVQRVWSRIGHPSMTDSAVAHVHTRYYIACHDDIIIKNSSWCKDARKHFTDDNVVACYGDDYEKPYNKEVLADGFQMAPLRQTVAADGRAIGLTQPKNWFVVCDKPKLMQINARWGAYHARTRVDKIPENVIKQDNANKVAFSGPFDVVSSDAGALLYYKIREAGYATKQLNDCLIHFGGMSWLREKLYERFFSRTKYVSNFEKELEEYPILMKIYNKHKIGISGITNRLT
jgi:hypothetical protein